MKTKRISLATRGTFGANIYNLYIVYSQIAAIYSQAETNDPNEFSKTKWDGLSESVLFDLSDLYGIWNSLQSEKDFAVPIFEDEQLAEKVESLSRRVETILNVLDLWVLIGRWPKAAYLCEKRIIKILAEFCERDKIYNKTFLKLLNACEVRQKGLIHLIEFYRNEEKRLSGVRNLSRLEKAG